MNALADPELQKRGAKFLSKFLNDLFLGVSRKNFIVSPKYVIHLPKLLMIFLLVIDLFHVLMCYSSVGGQIRSRHRYAGGGQNPCISTNSQCYHYSFCQLRWGPWPDLPPPLDPPLCECDH